MTAVPTELAQLTIVADGERVHTDGCDTRLSLSCGSSRPPLFPGFRNIISRKEAFYQQLRFERSDFGRRGVLTDLGEVR
jgi:hypothetical protein